MADLMGIDRRFNKQNPDYQQLLMGNFPNVDKSISGWWRYQAVLGELKDKKDGYELSLFNCSRYKFLLGAKFDVSARCCSVMKKNPAHTYHNQTGRNPMTAQMASESRLRSQQWLKNGCNGFNLQIPTSNPMSFWTEQDVLLYIHLHKDQMIYAPYRKFSRCTKGLMKYGKNYVSKETGEIITSSLKELGAICSVYGEIVKDYDGTYNIEGQMDLSELDESLGVFDTGRPLLKTTGCSRTGCVLCGFGCHLEKEGEGRFELLKKTHPKLYGLLDVVENNGVTMREAIDWINEHGNMNIKY